MTGFGYNILGFGAGLGIPPYQAKILVVAGGGGGGSTTGGGAGAGEVLYGATIDIVPNQTFTVTVGAGGAGSTYSGGTGSSSAGANSVFGTVTAIGGGGGGYSYSGTRTKNGGDGVRLVQSVGQPRELL